MKLGEFVIIILVVGLIFTAVSIIVIDMEDQYSEISVDKAWRDDYDFSSKINVSATKLQNAFAKIGKEEGWSLNKILATVSAIPTVVTEVPNIIFISLGDSISLVTGMSTDLSVPLVIISFFIIGLTVLVVFALLSWWHRSKI